MPGGNPKTLRLVLLGSYPTWPYRDRLGLTRDTRHVKTTWNVNLVDALARLPTVQVDFVTLVAGIPRSTTLRPSERLRLHFLRMERPLKALDLASGLRIGGWLVGRMLGGIRPHLVHGIGTEHPYAGIALRSGRPAVVTVHGLMRQVVRVAGVPWCSPKRAFARIEARVLAEARNLIAISPYVRDSLPRDGRPRRIWDIENPIDRRLFDGPEPSLAERRDLLFLGMVQPRKGLDVLVDAIGRMGPFARGLRVRVVGPVVPEHRAYAERVRQTIRERGLERHFEWLGSCDGEEAHAVLRRARALVLPSREESAPMVVAEAMACGTPVVATDVGGVRHMVAEPRTGVIVAPGAPDALATGIRRVLALDAGRLARDARREAQRFHPDRVAAATLNTYREVLSHEH